MKLDLALTKAAIFHDVSWVLSRGASYPTPKALDYHSPRPNWHAVYAYYVVGAAPVYFSTDAEYLAGPDLFYARRGTRDAAYVLELWHRYASFRIKHPPLISDLTPPPHLRGYPEIPELDQYIALADRGNRAGGGGPPRLVRTRRAFSTSQRARIFNPNQNPQYALDYQSVLNFIKVCA